MRSLSYLIIGALFVMAKCSLFDELGTINLDSTFSHSEDVSISENDPSTISEDFTVSATTDSEINRYKDKIKSYSVNSITLQILNYEGVDGITMRGTLEFGNVIVEINNLDLSALDQSGEEMELNIPMDDLAEVAQELEGGNDVSGSIEGTVSDKPVSFTLKLNFDVSLEAEVLE